MKKSGFQWKGTTIVEIDFQRPYWEQRLPYQDWYIRLEDELTRYVFPAAPGDRERKAFRHQAYEIVEELLESQQVSLAETGPDLDSERQSVDTLILHHTDEEPEIRLSKLSAIGLVRQYAFQYLHNNVMGRQVRGEPVWSGHFNNGRQVFYAYHWLIRPDGRVERLLEDHYIGWHAGNWDINTRSVGIAFSGQYTEATPPVAQIEAAARLVQEQYPQIGRSRILGHREVVETTCPGNYFLNGWKETLLEGI